MTPWAGPRATRRAPRQSILATHSWLRRGRTTSNLGGIDCSPRRCMAPAIASRTAFETSKTPGLTSTFGGRTTARGRATGGEGGAGGGGPRAILSASRIISRTTASTSRCSTDPLIRLCTSVAPGGRSGSSTAFGVGWRRLPASISRMASVIIACLWGDNSTGASPGLSPSIMCCPFHVGVMGRYVAAAPRNSACTASISSCPIFRVTIGRISYACGGVAPSPRRCMALVIASRTAGDTSSRGGRGPISRLTWSTRPSRRCPSPARRQTSRAVTGISQRAELYRIVRVVAGNFAGGVVNGPGELRVTPKCCKRHDAGVSLQVLCGYAP